MPVLNNCTTSCSGLLTEFQQHLFLGVTVSSFSANLGWNNQVSDLSVVLVEDTCPSNPSGAGKICFDSLLNSTVTYDADPGFYGENRYLVNGSEFVSACTEPDAALVSLVFSAVELVGQPAYFRVGNFEFSGIISDWVRTDDCNQGTTYRVKLVSPTQLLEGSELILGQYPGFFGENRYLVNGSEFVSACTEPDAALVSLVFSAVELVGQPAYFRVGNFEFSGIISDWVRTDDCNQGTTYRVKLVSPTQLLEGSELILGQYPGFLNQTTSGIDELPHNIFNIYGATDRDWETSFTLYVEP